MGNRIALCFLGAALLFFLAAGCAATDGGPPPDPAETIHEARRLDGAGETGAALALLTSFDGPEEGRKRCLEAAAEICLHHGQPSMAVLHLDGALRLDPVDATLLLRKGEALLFAGREIAAEAVLRSCLELDWGMDRAKIVLAGILFESGDDAKRKQAAAFLEAVSPGFDWDVEALLLLGYARHDAGRDDEALRLFEEAALLAPYEARPRFDRALLLERTGDRAGAETAYRQSLERDANHVPSLFNLGCLLAATGRAEEGRRLVDFAISKTLDPAIRRSLEKTRDRLFAEER